MFLKKVMIPVGLGKIALDQLMSEKEKKYTGGAVFERVIAIMFNGVQNGGNKSGTDVTLKNDIVIENGIDYNGKKVDTTIKLHAGDNIECKNNSINYANFGCTTIGAVDDIEKAIDIYTTECFDGGARVFAIQTAKDYFMFMDFDAFKIYLNIAHIWSRTSTRGGTRESKPQHKIGRATKYKKYAAKNNMIIF